MRRPLTVALDATYAAFPDRSGIGIYSEQLIRALARVVPAEKREQCRFVLAFRPGPYAKWALWQSWPQPFRRAPLLDPWLHTPRATLFHGLNQRLPEGPYPLRVITLHERYPAPSDAYSMPKFREHMGRRIESAIRNADLIITVSESVRQHLVRHDSALAARTRVIHHGVEQQLAAAAVACTDLVKQHFKVDPGKKFILNVGAVQTRKNVSNLVLALKPLRDVSLVVAGGDGYGAEEIRALVRREGMTDRVHFLGHVSPARLGLLYACAAALVFPSLEEAFGLPILEAMSYGLPVITSNVSAMPEVAGDAAILVDPHSVAAIRQAMQHVLQDQELAAELSRKGKRRATEFTWERCAMQTWAVYEELLKERR